MMLSTTLQSKISKTKKRLSEGAWYLPCTLLALMGLMGVFAFGMRLTTVSWNFGIISAQIPVMHTPLPDAKAPSAEVTPQGYISEHTPAVVMGNEAFFIGDLASFSIAAADVRNKIKVPHAAGAPQLSALMSALGQWHERRLRADHIKNPRFVVLVPSSDWPAVIVMQVIHHLKASPLYDEVVLGGGLR